MTNHHLVWFSVVGLLGKSTAACTLLVRQLKPCSAHTDGPVYCIMVGTQFNSVGFPNSGLCRNTVDFLTAV